MESITITFLESFPDGVRRLTTPNWAGACVVLSRKHIVSALRIAELTHSGVYILVGYSQAKSSDSNGTSEIYIGKSDTLDERLKNHHSNKDFWTTAFAFYHSCNDLHGGQIAQLEALLIEKARAGCHHVRNKTAPKLHSGQSEGMEAFALQIEMILQALGHDFFSPKALSEPAVTSERDVSDINTPENLKEIVSELRQVCLALPQTEFYATHIPDLRAKVVNGATSRVFARIRFNKHDVQLHRPGGAWIKIDEHSVVSESVKDNLRAWHGETLQNLTR